MFQPTVPGFLLAVVGPQSSLPRALSVLLITVQLWYCVQGLCLDMFGCCLWPRSSTKNGSKVKSEHSPASTRALALWSCLNCSYAIGKWSNKCMGIGSSLFWKSVLRNCIGAPILGFQAVDQTAVSHSCSCITTFRHGGGQETLFALHVLGLVPGSATLNIFPENTHTQHS